MNKVILMGRLTKDPELAFTQANNALCKFTLAVDRRFTAEGTEKTVDFIPIVAWRKTAEFCKKYFSKGQKIVVIGRLQVRNWDDNSGKRQYMTEVVVDEVYFADRKKENSDPSKGMSLKEPIEYMANNNNDDDGLPF